MGGQPHPKSDVHRFGAAHSSEAISMLSTLASQATFRVLLDALARPGRIFRLDPPSGVPPALLVPLALADPTQRVGLVGDAAARWEAALIHATGCRAAPPAEADLVVAFEGTATPDLVTALKRGSALSPEDGARLAVACGRLGAGGEVEVLVSGPGVDGTRGFAVAGCPAAVLDAVVETNRDFPAGVDSWLVAADGSVVGLPRSAALEVVEVGRWAT